MINIEFKRHRSTWPYSSLWRSWLTYAMEHCRSWCMNMVSCVVLKTSFTATRHRGWKQFLPLNPCKSSVLASLVPPHQSDRLWKQCSMCHFAYYENLAASELTALVVGKYLNNLMISEIKWMLNSSWNGIRRNKSVGTHSVYLWAYLRGVS